MITFMISVRLHEFNTGVLQPSSLKEISSQDYKHRGGYTPSLQTEKLWVLGTEEILGLPCSPFLRMTAPLNLVEINRLPPHDSVLLIQKLHWMLRIRQVSIERHDIVNDDVSGWLQTFFQLRDVDHVMHTCEGWHQLQSVCHISQPS
jgi:hypothetical protein